jgi:hypothetical protein
MKACGAVLTSDVGGDYVCTEPKGHRDDHCDATYPRSWPQGALRMTQGRIIKETR